MGSGDRESVLVMTGVARDTGAVDIGTMVT